MSLPVIRFISDKRLLVLVALSLVSYFVNLGKAPIYILDEAKNAQCAREMLQHNNWIVPTFNEQLRTDKPPLHYFAMALAYHFWGVSPFSARLFSAVCGLLVVIVTYQFLLLYSNKSTAFLAGLILLSSWHFNFEMRLSVPDPYLILITASSLYSFFIFYTSAYTKKCYLMLMYALWGLGVLSKGPVAFVLPAFSVIAFLAVRKQINWIVVKQLRIVYGLLLMLLICLPWYIWVNHDTAGEWTRGFFVKNNINRFVRIREKHGGFFLLSLLYVLIGMMPVTFFIVPIVRYIRSSFKTHVLVQFATIVACTVTLFFTVSRTQLPNYPMPCYPFLSIVAAFYFNHLFKRHRSFQTSLWLVLIFSLLLPIVIYILTHTEYSMMAFPRLWIVFLIVPVGALISLLIYQRADLSRHHIYAVSAMLFTFIATAWILNLYAYPEIYSSNPVANSIKIQKLREPLVAYHIYNPAFNFYLQQPVKRIENFEELKTYLEQHPNSQVVTRTQNLKELSALQLKLYFMGKDVFENHSTCLLE